MNSFPPDIETKIKSSKRKFGLAYGISAGLAFAAALWGPDAYQLAQAHAYLPWIKLVSGAVLGMLAGGLAGWLTARFERILLGVVFWLAAGGALAWLVTLVPLVITPFLASRINPGLQNVLDYTIYPNTPTRVALAFAWLVIGSLLCAALQMPLSDQSVFSASIFGKVAPLIVSVLLMGVSGAFVDELVNRPLRDPVIRIDQTIQYFVDTRGTQVDKKVARDLHIAALNPVESAVQPQRWIIVKDYDDTFELVNIVINFNGNWVQCSTMAGSPSICAPLDR